MSLNPHPIVLTSASERHRAELFALAETHQLGRPPLRGLSRWCWRHGAETRVVSGMLALLLAAARQA